MHRHTFLVRSATPDINMNINEVLRNVVRIDIGFVQCPAITANLDDFLYVVETDPNGQLESNGSSNVSGMSGNPPRCFLTLPAPSGVAPTTYTGGDFPITKPYTNPFNLQNIQLRVVNAQNQMVTFDAAGPDFGILFIVYTNERL